MAGLQSFRTPSSISLSLPSPLSPSPSQEARPLETRRGPPAGAREAVAAPPSPRGVRCTGLPRTGRRASWDDAPSPSHRCSTSSLRFLKGGPKGKILDDLSIPLIITVKVFFQIIFPSPFLMLTFHEWSKRRWALGPSIGNECTALTGVDTPGRDARNGNGRRGYRKRLHSHAPGHAVHAAEAASWGARARKTRRKCTLHTAGTQSQPGQDDA